MAGGAEMASLDRLAVVLFNLGGPDGPAAVEPFLFNLFSDPAIIRLPGPLRWLIAKIISRRRAPIARQIYAQSRAAIENCFPRSPAGTRSVTAFRPTDASDRTVDSRGVLVRANDCLQHFWRRTC